MCNVTSLAQKQEKLEAHYTARMEVPLLYTPYFERSAYTYPNLFMITQEHADTIVPASWGFVPETMKSNVTYWRKSYDTWNAKSENVLSPRSAFGFAVRNKRCLILADGFFEPHYYVGEKNPVPHYCFIQDGKKDRSIFAFAGVYSQIDHQLFTCSILTTKANGFFSKVHNKKKRMPLVLDSTFEREWLRDLKADTPIKEIMQNGFTRETFRSHPVSRDLYRKDVPTDLPYIIGPVPPPLTLF